MLYARSSADHNVLVYTLRFHSIVLLNTVKLRPAHHSPNAAFNSSLRIDFAVRYARTARVSGSLFPFSSSVAMKSDVNDWYTRSDRCEPRVHVIIDIGQTRGKGRRLSRNRFSDSFSTAIAPLSRTRASLLERRSWKSSREKERESGGKGWKRRETEATFAVASPLTASWITDSSWEID